MLTLAFPGFLPMIHIGWDMLAEVSHQTILDGRIENPAEVLWKGLSAGLTGVLAKETRTVSEALATRALRAEIVRGVSDATVRSFVKVFGTHAVETVKDGFILGPIHRVLMDGKAEQIVANPQRFGAMIFEEIRDTCDIQSIMKTLINEALFQSVRGSSRK